MANGQGALTRAAQAAQAVPPPGGAPAGAVPGGPPPGPGGPPPGPGGPPPAQGPLGMPAGPDTLPPNAPVPGPHAEIPGGNYNAEGIDPGEEPATPAEEAEYQRARGALDKVLFEEDAIADDVMAQLDPNDPISTVAKASTLVVQQLDEKIDLDEVVIPQITIDTVDSVIELAENRFGGELPQQTSEAILGAAWEGVMAMFGIDEQQVAQLQQEYADQLPAMEKAHYGFLGEAKPTPAGAAGDAAGAVPPTPSAQGPARPMPPAGGPPPGGMPPGGGAA